MLGGGTEIRKIRLGFCLVIFVLEFDWLRIDRFNLSCSDVPAQGLS